MKYFLYIDEHNICALNNMPSNAQNYVDKIAKSIKEHSNYTISVQIRDTSGKVLVMNKLT